MSEDITVVETFPGWGGYKNEHGGLATTQLVMQGTVPIGKVFTRGTRSFGIPLTDSELISPHNLPDILNNLKSRGIHIDKSVWHVIQVALAKTNP